MAQSRRTVEPNSSDAGLQLHHHGWVRRTNASHLREAGLGEFVAEGLESHIAQALCIANDPKTPVQLTGLRRMMRERLRRSSVCDTATFARRMEAMYEGLVAGQVRDADPMGSNR